MARRVEKGSVWFNYTRKAEGDPGGEGGAGEEKRTVKII